MRDAACRAPSASACLLFAPIVRRGALHCTVGRQPLTSSFRSRPACPSWARGRPCRPCPWARGPSACPRCCSQVSRGQRSSPAAPGQAEQVEGMRATVSKQNTKAQLRGHLRHPAARRPAGTCTAAAQHPRAQPTSPATPPHTWLALPLAMLMRSMALRTRSSLKVFSCTRNWMSPSVWVGETGKGGRGCWSAATGAAHAACGAKREPGTAAARKWRSLRGTQPSPAVICPALGWRGAQQHPPPSSVLLPQRPPASSSECLLPPPTVQHPAAGPARVLHSTHTAQHPPVSGALHFICGICSPLSTSGSAANKIGAGAGRRRGGGPGGSKAAAARALSQPATHGPPAAHPHTASALGPAAVATWPPTRQHPAAPGSTRQHPAAPGSTRQHPAAPGSTHP